MEFGAAPAVSWTESPVPAGFHSSYLRYRNTYFWDKEAMAKGAGDFSKARITHWLQHGDNGYSSSIKESTKGPMEGRVWYHYGQPETKTHLEGPSQEPLAVVRVLDDGTEQRTTFEYNDLGKVTRQVDPCGRVTTYTYDTNQIDLLEVCNETKGVRERLAVYTYNRQHKPLTATDAAGQTTRFTCNAEGQVVEIQNPLGETTRLSYDRGYLMQVQGPGVAAKTTFTYDKPGRVASVTTAGDQTTRFEYDALDRRTRVTYPDGTYEETVYDRLDVSGVRDRAGRWTLLAHNALRQLEKVQDPQGRITQFGWCGCGKLESLTDPMGHTTMWVRDMQGRIISKIYEDRTQTKYGYDIAGRLKQRIDAMGQMTNYAYFPDNNLKEVSYVDAKRPTPGVCYTYDDRYSRVATMVDGTGTTRYTYVPIGFTPGAGRLATVTSPMANSTIAYRYDALGQVAGRSINGVEEARTFDLMGRVSQVVNPLGAFGYRYSEATGNLAEQVYPNGQISRFIHSEGKRGQTQLREILHLRSKGSTISGFGYAHDVMGQIAEWRQQAESQIPKVYAFENDAVGQLLRATLREGVGTGKVLRDHVYGYDLGGNRTSEEVNGAVTTATFNTVNQVMSQRSNPAALPASGLEEKGSATALSSGKGGGVAEASSVLPNLAPCRSGDG
jgi:YD repeat-containing protein